MGKLSVVFEALRELAPVLKRNLGPMWLVTFTRAYMKSGKLFKSTSWGTNPSDESEFVKPLAVIPSLYFMLIKKWGREEAYKKMEDILEQIALQDDFRVCRREGIFEETDSFKRWLLFKKHLLDKTNGWVNLFHFKEISDKRIYYTQSRCIYLDFFSELNVKELTYFFCNVDRKIYARLFPQYSFHRDHNSENTLAYGAKECIYCFEQKNKK